MVLALVGVLHIARGADLASLYTLAQASDPIFQAARFTLEATKQKRPEAFSALLPALSANGSANLTSGITNYSNTPEVGRSFRGDQWMIELRQPLLRMDNVWAYDEARALVEQAVADYHAAAQDLILRFSRAYFDVVVADRHVRAAQSELEAMNEQLQAAQHSYAAGVASVTDVDDSRSRSALAQAQKEAALSDLEAARATLEAITGIPVGDISPLRAAAGVARPAPDNVARWIEMAIDANPRVKSAQALGKVAEFEMSRSRTQRLPVVDLVASYGANYSSGNITEPVNFSSNVHDKQVTIQFTLPLIDGGALHAQVAESRAKRAKAQVDVEGARRQATVDAKQAYAAIISGIAEVDALHAAVEAGQSAVKGNRIGYGLGIRINSDVLNAQQQLYGTEHDLEKARYDTLFQGLKLKAAAGVLTEGDVASLNELLEPIGTGNTAPRSSSTVGQPPT